MIEQRGASFREAGYISGIDEIALASLLNDFRDAIQFGGDDGEIHRHRFEQGHGQTLESGGHEQDVGGGIDLAGVGDVTGEDEPVSDTQLAGFFAKHRFLGSLTSQEETQIREPRTERGRHIEKQREIFLRIQSANPGDHWGIRRQAEFRAGIPSRDLARRESTEIDGIRHQRDFFRRDRFVLNQKIPARTGNGDDVVRESVGRFIKREEEFVVDSLGIVGVVVIEDEWHAHQSPERLGDDV